MKKDQFEAQKYEIKRKYNKFAFKAITTGITSMLIGFGTFIYGSIIRPKISENPYRNTKSVVEYKLTLEELEKIQDSKKQLESIYSNLDLNLPYMPEDLKPRLEEFSNRTKKEKLASIIDKYTKDEQETNGKLNNLEINTEVKNYDNWYNGEDLVNWLMGFMGIGITLMISASFVDRRRDKKISELEKRIAQPKAI